MAGLPLRHLVATALLGDQESAESVLLADVFSSGGSRNLSIDKNGRIASILGYTKQNPAAVLTLPFFRPTLLRAIYHYVTNAGGVITRQEIGIFDDNVAQLIFAYSIDTGVTWVSIGNIGGASSIGTIPDFAGSGNLLFLTNGVIAPAQWDGANLTTAGSVQLAAPTYAKTGAGTLNGNVSFRILPMVGNVRKLSSVQSINYAMALETGTLSWAADPDVTVTGYEIYRTTGTGQVFYNEGTVVGRLTVTFTVGAAGDTDANLIINRVLAEFGDPPPVGAYFVVAHKERLFYIRTNANPRTAYYSDPGVPYSCYLAFNKIDFTDAESFTDVATGGTGDFLGLLVLWQERSIWVLSGTGEISGTVRDFTRRRANAQMGTVSHRTVVRIPAGAAFTDPESNTKKTSQVTLAYLTPLGDIRLFDGDNDEIISHPKAKTLSTANYAARRKSFALHDRQRQEVTWIYADGVSTEPNVGVVWNYRWGTWYTRDWPFAGGTEVETPNSASVLLAGNNNAAAGGYCYKLWSGFTLDGANINSQWMTKTLYGTGFFGDPSGLYGKPLVSHRKRWRWADLIFAIASGNVTVTVEWIVGDDPDDTAVALSSRVITLPAGTILTADGTLIQTSDGSIVQLLTTPSELRAQLKTQQGKYAHSRGLRLRFKISTSSAQWFLTCIDVAYQLLPGEKRTIGSIP